MYKKITVNSYIYTFIKHSLAHVYFNYNNAAIKPEQISESEKHQ